MAELAYLIDHPEAIDEVAAWWFEAWGGGPHPSSESLAQELREELHRDAFPTQVVALEGGQVIGSAVLKHHEMQRTFPELEFWLGNVYVKPEHRGHQLATQLALHVETLARERGLPHLYLATEQLDGGLYARIGYQPIQQTPKGDLVVLLMKKDLQT